MIPLVAGIINDKLNIVSREKLLKSTQELLASSCKYSASAVDMFLKERYEEAERENKKYLLR